MIFAIQFFGHGMSTDLDPNCLYSEAQPLLLFSLLAAHGCIENTLTSNSVLAITSSSPHPNQNVAMVMRTLIFISLSGNSPQMHNLLGNKTESNSSYLESFYLSVFQCSALQESVNTKIILNNKLTGLFFQHQLVTVPAKWKVFLVRWVTALSNEEGSCPEEQHPWPVL